MKIAFVGTHGVGKTTLSHELVAQLRRRGVNADMVREVARTSPLPINQQTSLDAQIWILMTQVADEIHCAAQHDVVVCDRSALDNYAYLLRACGPQAALEPFVSYWMRTYDVLYKVPVTGLALPDGVRDTDEAFVNDIDRRVDRLLHEYAVPHVRLDPAARDTWIALALQHIHPAVRKDDRDAT